ncbi:LOW QUALITY PROTEIN: inactive caspase-12-like [Heliangelus exortis]|uniref:LOW QUALITY PROTEIN: inactive caspase-12-like n=1 Tax=Heliangelus exortis TaxID=472823 RepID=UPI003A8D8ED9
MGQPGAFLPSRFYISVPAAWRTPGGTRLQLPAPGQGSARERGAKFSPRQVWRWTRGDAGLPIGIQGHQWIQQCSQSKYQDIRDTEGDQGMAPVMRDLADFKEHLTSDSTFLVFMSQGVGAGLCGTKRTSKITNILALNTIYEKFNNKHCQADPKWSLSIQSCCGNHTYNSNLQELFQQVQYSFGKFPWQLPSQEQTTMFKKLYLFPGH